MIRYKLYQNNNASNAAAYGRWYARVAVDETYDTEALAEHMANHNTPYSAGTIHGVLNDMISCIKELILDGKNVKLDDLAIFSAGLTSTGAATADEFSASENITKVRLRARATGELTSAVLTREAVKKQLSEYSITSTVSSDDDDDDE